jgi:DNA-binding transcriptional LysR family regulator
MTRAAGRLDMAVQTVSAQVRELERDLGCQLLKPAGRGLALTEAGVEALRQAEQIFQLGETLPDKVRQAAQAPAMRLAVGIADGLAKLEVQRLLQPLLTTPDLRLVCHEGEMAELLAELALHQLDVVLADHPAPFNPHIKVHSHPLGTTGMGWYATPHWQTSARAAAPAGPRRSAPAPARAGRLGARLELVDDDALDLERRVVVGAGSPAPPPAGRTARGARSRRSRTGSGSPARRSAPSGCRSSAPAACRSRPVVVGRPARPARRAACRSCSATRACRAVRRAGARGIRCRPSKGVAATNSVGAGLKLNFSVCSKKLGPRARGASAAVAEQVARELPCGSRSTTSVRKPCCAPSRPGCR